MKYLKKIIIFFVLCVLFLIYIFFLDLSGLLNKDFMKYTDKNIYNIHQYKITLE